MNKVIGILAPVDGGKTTLSEQLLYKCGSIRTAGRVDHGDSFLDTDEMERSRGITVYSSEAEFVLPSSDGSINITLLDTPGHVDLAAEMERTLNVLDLCVLVVNAGDGVTSYVKTLWKLLNTYQIPTWIFINKIDLEGIDPQICLTDLTQHLSENCIPLDRNHMEDVALVNDSLMEFYLESGDLSPSIVSTLIDSRRLFPVSIGSALKDIGLDEFISSLGKFAFASSISKATENKIQSDPAMNSGVSTKIYKISRDNKGTRLTHMKILSGTLHVKDLFNGEKIDQIRIYNGASYRLVSEVISGQICAVTGLNNSVVAYNAFMVPVMTYELIPQENIDPLDFRSKLLNLSEESPEITFDFRLPDNSSGTSMEILAHVMGEIQLDVLTSVILNRYGVHVSWGPGKVIYKETISHAVRGIGHYEPLKHYAEAHIQIDPLPRGSGIQIGSDLSEDELSRNYQHLIMTHLGERKHKGVLTGSELTDVKFTLKAGRSHLKHTEGGDFREATYRAVRHALRASDASLLLEPMYSYELTVPINLLGKAMKDIEIRGGSCDTPLLENDSATITGHVPVAGTTDYHREVMSYTNGKGRFYCAADGYAPCHNAPEVINAIGYDPDLDTENPCGSVFCSHGAGYYVNWDLVEKLAHIK